MRYVSKASPESLRGTALLRLDFNTEDDWRMRAVLPTIRFLLKTSPRIIIVSHRGRPEGVDKKFSLKRNAAALGDMLGRPVVFIGNFRFSEIERTVAKSPRGSVFLLENLRFNPGEEKNDAKFAKQLASLADFYVNDAFAVSHRANASVAAITKFLPSYAGLELEREIGFLSQVMKRPKRPFVFVVGGAKAEDKLDAVKFFKNKADWFLLGGALANTILNIRGMDVKKSVRAKDPGAVRAIAAFSKLKKVLIPIDFRWGGDFLWDIGPKTTAQFVNKIAAAKTIFWSGPLGLIEKPAYAHGSLAVAKAIAKNRRALSVTGGGETVMFLKKYHLDKKFTFISTGGGAMIDFLAGKKLPGIAALEKSKAK